MSDILKKKYRVTMPDGSKYDVPVEVIARDRAKYYADDFDNDIERSLSEDTVPLFEEDRGEIFDWAGNEMNWEDVKEHAVKVDEPLPPVDFDEGWNNGEREIVE